MKLRYYITDKCSERHVNAVQEHLDALETFENEGSDPPLQLDAAIQAFYEAEWINMRKEDFRITLHNVDRKRKKFTNNEVAQLAITVKYNGKKYTQLWPQNFDVDEFDLPWDQAFERGVVFTLELCRNVLIDQHKQ